MPSTRTLRRRKAEPAQNFTSFIEPIKASEKPSSSLGRVPGFLTKAFEIFSNPSFSSLCSWGRNGQTIVVYKIPDFATTVLPKYFKHSNYASFVRQLNMYDFHKTVANPLIAEFHHPHFQQGRPDLLHLIKRKSKNSEREDKEIEPHTPPTRSEGASTRGEWNATPLQSNGHADQSASSGHKDDFEAQPHITNCTPNFEDHHFSDTSPFLPSLEASSSDPFESILPASTEAMDPPHSGEDSLGSLEGLPLTKQASVAFSNGAIEELLNRADEILTPTAGLSPLILDRLDSIESLPEPGPSTALTTTAPPQFGQVSFHPHFQPPDIPGYSAPTSSFAVPPVHESTLTLPSRQIGDEELERVISTLQLENADLRQQLQGLKDELQQQRVTNEETTHKVESLFKFMYSVYDKCTSSNDPTAQAVREAVKNIMAENNKHDPRDVFNAASRSERIAEQMKRPIHDESVPSDHTDPAAKRPRLEETTSFPPFGSLREPPSKLSDAWPMRPPLSRPDDSQEFIQAILEP